jgi:hypothetical protein
MIVHAAWCMPGSVTIPSRTINPCFAPFAAPDGDSFGFSFDIIVGRSFDLAA